LILIGEGSAGLAGNRRSADTLPARAVAHLTTAIFLFSDENNGKIAATVNGSPSDWRCSNTARSLPIASGISEARKRLGREVMHSKRSGAVATADALPFRDGGCGS
jgi:hypothetical protein